VAEQVTFKRNIGLFMAVMIGIGAMMGPGIFALPGELAHMVGPLGIFAYLAMGLLTMFTALNYSELGAAIPLAGGGYSFTSRTLPKPVAFLTGWFFWIGNTLACAMYALIFALTIRAYFWPNISIPVLVFATTIIFSGINFLGMAAALKIITVMNLVELAILLIVSFFGAFRIEPQNLTPFAPMGFIPFFPGMALIYISYVGFDLITVASEEIIAPGKTIPRAITITMAVGIAIYVFVIFTMMGTVHYTELAQSDVPFIFTADRLFGVWGRWSGILATMMASLSAFSVTLGASARILYALGRDGHFPRFFATLHKRFRTPHVSLLICASIVIVFAASGIVKLVASVSDFGYLMAQGIVNISVIALRKRMPNLRRPFNVVLFPVAPICGVLACWLFVPALEFRSLVFGAILTVIGGAVYITRPTNRAQFAELPKALAGRMRQWSLLRRRKKMRVLIIDGGNQGQNIAKRLLNRDEYWLLFRSSEHQITFIEENETLCKEIEQQFNVPIYQGDGTKKEIIEQVGLENIDVAIASSEDDGRNVIAALQAKRLGVQQVIAIVQDPDYLPLLEENGVVAISAPWATAAMVENYLDRPGVADLFEISSGVASLVGMVVPEDARVAGKLIRNIEVPMDCVVAAVIRGKQFVVPRGDTKIHVGDQVVFVGPTGAIKKAQEMFLLKA
jgi:amino acid transporter/Trk K+ transport system NAD-binding subunit